MNLKWGVLFAVAWVFVSGPLNGCLLAQPANNEFASRVSLNGASPTASGSNVSATKEAGEPDHGDNAGGASVW
jgi:hypothetical protein